MKKKKKKLLLLIARSNAKCLNAPLETLELIALFLMQTACMCSKINLKLAQVILSRWLVIKIAYRCQINQPY